MDTPNEETHERQQNKDKSSPQVPQQEVDSMNIQQRIVDEDKFTWEASDLVHFRRPEDIPGYTPFPEDKEKRRKIPWSYPSADTEQ